MEGETEREGGGRELNRLVMRAIHNARRPPCGICSGCFLFGPDLIAFNLVRIQDAQIAFNLRQISRCSDLLSASLWGTSMREVHLFP